MTESLGWMVAALVAVGALIVGWLRSSRVGELGPYAPGKHVAFPPVDPEGVRERATVVEATEGDIEAILEGLETDDPAGAIADASNRSRSSR